MNCLTEYDEEATMRAFRKEGYEDGRAYGYTEGIATGLAKGKQEKGVEDARKLLALNTMSVEQIAYITELSIEQVRELQQQTVVNA
ncbi:MAG: hypothetical protein J5647_08290 [Spirochaetaceae bacterium]|nr:hypothetical protein [Spirochaetaceae bacterium]